MRQLGQSSEERELSPGTLDRARVGDREAFGELYRAFEPRLKRYCTGRLRNGAEADDAVSESFLKAMTALPHLGPDVPFFPWLQVICRNVCTDMQRRSMRDRDHSRAVVSNSHSAEDTVIASIGVAHARQAISKLSEREQNVFNLRSSFGLSSAEIATVTNLTPSYIDRSVYRTRQYLRMELQSVLSAAFIGGMFRLRGRFAMLRSWMSNRAHAIATAVGLHNAAPIGRVLPYLALAGILAGGTTLAVTQEGGAGNATAAALGASVSASASHKATTGGTSRAVGPKGQPRFPNVITSPGNPAVVAGGLPPTDLSGAPISDPITQPGSGSGSPLQGSSGTGAPGTTTPGGGTTTATTLPTSSQGGNTGAGGVIGKTLGTIGTTVGSTLNNTTKAVGDTLGAVSSTVKSTTQQLGSTTKQITDDVGSTTKQVTDAVGSTTKQVTQAAGQTVTTVVQAAGSTVSSTTQTLTQTLATALPPIAPVVSSLTSTTTTTSPSTTTTTTTTPTSTTSAPSSTTTTTNPVQGIVRTLLGGGSH